MLWHTGIIVLSTKLMPVHFSKTLDAHEGHQVEEHARHEFHETRVGHGFREVACQMLLNEEEIIVLEVAERAKMVAL